jgi:hypothetical protein
VEEVAKALLAALVAFRAAAEVGAGKERPAALAEAA